MLSVQVHPDDIVAKQRHNAYGKTEMWYVVDADTDAELIIGFKHDSSRKFIEAVEQNRVEDLLHKQVVHMMKCSFCLPVEFMLLVKGY